MEMYIEWFGEDARERILHCKLNSIELQVSSGWAEVSSKISLSFVPSSDFKQLRRQIERIGRPGATEGRSARLADGCEAVIKRRKDLAREVDLYVSDVRI